MAETFEEQETEAAEQFRSVMAELRELAESPLSSDVRRAISAYPAPVLALLSDDALEAEMQRRKETADG